MQFLEICTDCTCRSKRIFFCCNYHISLTRTSNWKWNLDHAIEYLHKEMNYYCYYNMMYIVYIFSVKKKYCLQFCWNLNLSLETKWVINITTFVFSCLQVIDISNMLKKDWKHRNLHHTWIHSRSLQVFNKNKKSAQPVELQMVQ